MQRSPYPLSSVGGAPQNDVHVLMLRVLARLSLALRTNYNLGKLPCPCLMMRFPVTTWRGGFKNKAGRIPASCRGLAGAPEVKPTVGRAARSMYWAYGQRLYAP